MLGLQRLGFEGFEARACLRPLPPKRVKKPSSCRKLRTVIGADGELHTYDRYTADPLIWKTLTASLGLAGIVTRVRLRVEPAFNLDVEVSVLSDADIGEGAGPVDYASNSVELQV